MPGGELPCAARVRPADAHAAFDDAAEHIATRLRRYRRRVSAHARDMSNRRANRRPDGNMCCGGEFRRGGPLNDAEALHATIVAESDASIETLSVRDAVMRLDLAFQQVLMFRNFKNGQLNVVYRRPGRACGVD